MDRQKDRHTYQINKKKVQEEFIDIEMDEWTDGWRIDGMNLIGLTGWTGWMGWINSRKDE